MEIDFFKPEDFRGDLSETESINSANLANEILRERGIPVQVKESMHGVGWSAWSVSNRSVEYVTHGSILLPPWPIDTPKPCDHKIRHSVYLKGLNDISTSRIEEIRVLSGKCSKCMENVNED